MKNKTMLPVFSTATEARLFKQLADTTSPKRYGMIIVVLPLDAKSNTIISWLRELNVAVRRSATIEILHPNADLLGPHLGCVILSDAVMSATDIEQAVLRIRAWAPGAAILLLTQGDKKYSPQRYYQSVDKVISTPCSRIDFRIGVLASIDIRAAAMRHATTEKSRTRNGLLRIIQPVLTHLGLKPGKDRRNHAKHSIH